MLGPETVSMTPPSDERAPAQAAILLIGDELLSAKVRDENGYFLAKMLRRRGIRLRELCIVPDQMPAIGAALLRLAEEVEILFTAGGVGPTHDDLTLAAIARAVGRPLERHPAMAARLRAHYGPELTEGALHMADLPSGTQLLADEGWPVLRLDLRHGRTRVYILPGVPGLLQLKIEQLEALPDELPQGEGWHQCLVHTTLEESQLAPHLDAVVAAFPDVEIGSYPRWSPAADGTLGYHVRVTLEVSRDRAERAELARQALLAAIPQPRRLAAEP